MGMRWFDVVGALVVAAMCLGACTSREGDRPTSAARENPTSSTVASTTTPQPSTSTSAASGVLRAAPGEAVEFEVESFFADLGDRGELFRSYPRGTKVVVSVRRSGEAPGRETSAYFGTAEVRSVDDARVSFRVQGRVPPSVWRREQRGRIAVEVPTQPGDYEVGLTGLFERPVIVVAVVDPVASTTTTMVPDRGQPSARVLGERDLAGVAFGRPEADAVDALQARFGPPSFDDRDDTECGLQRTVGWGSLVTTFRTDTRAGATGDRVFAAYTYHAPRTATAEGPQGLRTTNGLAPGASLAELRAVEPSVVFTTEPVGYALTTWYAAEGARLAGRLSDDVSAPGTSVTEVSSSIERPERATYPECALAPARR